MISVKTGDVWVLTLDRAEKANALTSEMLQQLLDALVDARNQRPAGLVLTGAGKVFSAGADLEEVKAGGLANNSLWESVSQAVFDLPFMSIAALNGTLAGGAFGMAPACDARFSVENAKFFYPVMALGVLPQPSDPGRMSDLIGPSKTALLLQGGQKVSADTALTWGLIDRIVDDPVSEAFEVLQSSQKASPEHRAAIKALMRNRRKS